MVDYDWEDVMRKKSVGLTGFMFMLFLCLGLFANRGGAEDVVILAENDFVPFSTPEGKGLSNEIVSEAFKAVNINAKIEIFPFARLMVMVKEGQAIGGFNAVPTDDTKPDYLFGKEPIYTSHMNFFYHVEDPVVIDTEADIATKISNQKMVVGDVVGYIYPPDYVKMKDSKAFIVESVNSDQILIKKLAAKRNKVALMTVEVANYHIQNLGVKDKIGYGKYTWEAPLFIAFSKKNPKAQHYMEQFDKGMAIIKSNGIYQKILGNYPYL